MLYNLFITAGDPSGIGVEIILKFFNQINLKKLEKKYFKDNRSVCYYLVGTKEIFCLYAKLLKIRINFSSPLDPLCFSSNHSLQNLSLSFPQSCNEIRFIDVPSDNEFAFSEQSIGRMNAGSGCLAFRYLEVVSIMVKNQLIDSEEALNKGIFSQSVGVVSAPVSKEAIILVKNLNRNFIDQTQFWMNQFRVKKVSMTFFNDWIRLLLLTTHIPLNSVSKAMTPSNIFRVLDHAIEIQKLTKDKNPILFLGINPHAGENGQMGKEDQKIKTAIRRYQKLHPMAGITLPMSADTAFIPVIQGKYRTVIATYHDQGLIPFKTISYHWNDPGVQVTWGLPFLRTSVDHGTAFDISGKNKANWYSFQAAVEQHFKILIGYEK